MSVPRLRVQEDLHEANTALDQAAGQEAALGVLATLGIVQSIEPASLSRFLGNVQHLGHGSLHASGQLIMTNASLQFRAVREAGQVGGVELLKELKLVATRGRRN